MDQDSLKNHIDSKDQVKTNSLDEKIPGTSLEDEQKILAEILAVADENLQKARATVQGLADELHELKEVYDDEDKEGLAQWFNTDSRFQQVRQDLLRYERGRKKPYFGRIDFSDTTLQKPECYYIGRSVIARDAAKPMVIDWRAPIASVYYEKSLGKCNYSVKGEGSYEIDLTRKRTYEIENDQLKDFYDTDVVANDELLTKYLARNKRAVLSEIIATIQQEQNEIIRKNPRHNLIVQGGAGSGKTTVAMHRISYILYNYEVEFKPKDFYIIGSNRVLLNYITGILPDLDVYGISQMTMEQLFIRLLYEDWDDQKYTIKKQNKKDSNTAVKGSFGWFQDLEDFCCKYEWNYIPRKDIAIEKTNKVLLEQSAIEHLIKKFSYLSLPDKLDKLTEHLMTQLENELYGKYYTYPAEEKKLLIKKYQNYFGRREWKGSIYKLYDEFIKQQIGKGYKVNVPDSAFDLYDLAALAYLYKRIKETEVIQEASHVVIDEAQDFGMMVYGALKYCLTKCTYTIMGDVSQNIYFDYGLSDWEELRRLMLPETFDYFGLLKKSYRNTVEISEFATNILQHGNFPIYPVEPIIRHGNAVKTISCHGETGINEEVVKIISEWEKQGYETIAVICRDEAESIRVTKCLGKQIEVKDFNSETEEFGSGIMVLPIEYSKGLEFDAVLLYNASEDNYPEEDGYAKLLYVATTRALHELVVLYSGKLSGLIATPVPEDKKNKFVVKVEAPKPVVIDEDTRTKKEIEIERANEGHREMEMRSKIGPKRIVINKPKEEAPKKAYARTFIGNYVNPSVSIEVKSVGLAAVGNKIMGAKGEINVGTNGKGNNINSQKKYSEFGSMPDNNSLRPIGHPSLNYAVRWASSNKNYVEVTSACGILRIIPISSETVRVVFSKEPIDKLREVPIELTKTKNVKWNYRELRDKVEVSTDRLIVRVDKKSGVLSFYTVKEKLLLSESSKLPRQLGNVPKYQTWAYFSWTKKESIMARGEDDNWLDLNAKAKYISFGNQSNRPACIMSNAGYQLLLPAGVKVMCCTIPAYGSYIHTEDKQIDYFFRSAL